MAPAREDSAALADNNVRVAMSRPANEPRRDGDEGSRSPLLGDVRTRVLVSFFVLLIVSTAVSLLVLRQVLISRIGNDVRETLTAQVEPLRTIAATGRDPKTGKPLNGDLEQIFDSYLGQERAADDGFLATFIAGKPGQAEPADTQIPASLAVFSVDRGARHGSRFHRRRK